MSDIYRPDAAALAAPASQLELAIAAWLNTKAGKSQSKNTRTEYARTLRSYQEALLLVGLDLDSNQPQAMGLVCQQWAAQRSANSNREGEVAPSTYNLRVSVVSSFYEFAIRRKLLTGESPTIYVERRKKAQYESAQPLSIEFVKSRLAAIDRTSLIGKRDYALLALGLSTGRRMQEIVSVTCCDVAIEGQRVTVTFTRTKGGTIMRDNLSEGVGKALLDWLRAFHKGTIPSDGPVWVRLTPAGYGNPLGWQSLGDICKRHLGTTKVHTLRHTFAHTMEQQGATVTDIQRRLGHTSLDTTSRYLKALSSADNPVAEKLADAMGIE